MFNRLLALTMAATIGWSFGVAPISIATAQSRLERSAADVRPAIGINQAQDQSTLRAPVPLVRVTRMSAAAIPAPVELPAAKEAPASAEAIDQAELDRKAAEASAVRDGYKRVSVLGKTGTGAWRVKAYRGSTEVRLTVDASGRVSLD